MITITIVRYNNNNNNNVILGLKGKEKKANLRLETNKDNYPIKIVLIVTILCNSLTIK